MQPKERVETGEQAYTLALPPIRDTLIEGFRHFVTSMTAPIASGWSGCRVGLAPLECATSSPRTPISDVAEYNFRQSVPLDIGAATILARLRRL